jgi:hypothetical protein
LTRLHFKLVMCRVPSRTAVLLLLVGTMAVDGGLYDSDEEQVRKSDAISPQSVSLVHQHECALLNSRRLKMCLCYA